MEIKLDKSSIKYRRKMKKEDSLPYTPVKCVVCTGFGTVNWGKQTCHACKGEGYLLVPSERREESGEYEQNK